MSVRDVLWEIETAIEDLFDDPIDNCERQVAQSRRSVYEQTLVDVNRIAGSEAMYLLSRWIEREIRTARRLPAGHEVRQIGTEICRRTTPQSSSPPTL